MSKATCHRLVRGDKGSSPKLCWTPCADTAGRPWFYVCTLLGQETCILLSYPSNGCSQIWHLYIICKWSSCIWTELRLPKLVFREKPASQRRCKAPQLLRPVTLNRTAADNKCKDSFGSQGSKTQDFSCHTIFVPGTVMFSTPLSDVFKFI